MTHPKPHSKVQLELIAADSRFPSLHYTMLNLGRSSCPVPVEWAEFFSKGKHSQFSGVRWGALRAPASTTEQGSPRAPLVVPLPLLGKLQKRPVEPHRLPDFSRGGPAFTAWSRLRGAKTAGSLFGAKTKHSRSSRQAANAGSDSSHKLKGTAPSSRHRGWNILPGL